MTSLLSECTVVPLISQLLREIQGALHLRAHYILIIWQGFKTCRGLILSCLCLKLTLGQNNSVWRNPKSDWNRYRNFYWYQKISKPIPIVFSIPKIFKTDTDTFFAIPNFFETDTDTFSETNFFSKPIPIPSKNMEKFRNRIWSFLDQNLWTG